ncbi:glycosyltransferase family 2 protein [Mangrovicoccus sp. HB161399]|uniref:glycosyltransferase family 2 protein n=1 Tax=Mangrovicoccus sp. HB161399 TaxID=2720392 RepID=UPI001552F493|nr:glycosyltransferase family 2 protein [Mangrovicoccus sp. HB161399]
MQPRPPPKVAVLTMVRDDEEFLRIWAGHYGRLFGMRSLYVVSHGDPDMVRDVAAGTNVLPVPYEPDPRFDAQRWQLLNHLAQGLRLYHDRVIVGDVDEIVLADPKHGTLPAVLARHRRARALTPFGLELVHRPAEEPLAFAPPVLRARRHVRIAPLYAKPCLMRGDIRLSRGGHYASSPRLVMPEGLYLLHLKHADRGLYRATADRRNATAEATGAARPRDAMIGRHWFAEARDDRAEFAAIDGAEVREDFGFAAERQAIADSWAPRPGTPFYEFKLAESPLLYRLPERFAGLL